MNTLNAALRSPRIVVFGVVVLAMAAGGIWWHDRQQEYQQTHLKSDVTTQQKQSDAPSPAPTASPEPTASPTTTSDSVHRESGGTTVDVSNRSSQSGSGSNYNSNSTNVTINGQSSTTKTTTINGYTTTETTP